jgi:hypothetical protein
LLGLYVPGDPEKRDFAGICFGHEAIVEMPSVLFGWIGSGPITNKLWTA